MLGGDFWSMVMMVYILCLKLNFKKESRTVSNVIPRVFSVFPAFMNADFDVLYRTG